jgi:YD repeat-containing protein
MRAAIAVICTLGLGHLAAAAPPDDPDAPRPDLRAVTLRTYAAHHALRVVEVRTYDAAGHLVDDLFRDDHGHALTHARQTFDAQGHLTRRQVDKRSWRFTTTLDGHGRIAELVTRDDGAPPGEDRQAVWTWEPSGGHAVRTYRRYAHEGPYPDRSEAYDAAGRETSSCDLANHVCAMTEYDDHGHVTRIRQQNAEQHQYLIFDNTHDAAGHLTEVRRGPETTTYTYDDHDDVIVARHTSGDGEASEADYAYDRR